MSRVFEIAFELAGRVNSTFNNSFGSANSRLQQMNRQISSTRSEMRELERAQRSGGVTLAQYIDRQAELTRQLQAAERAQRSLANATRLQERANSFRSTMRGNMVGAVETGFALAVPVKIAMDFESSMADVQKVVDFDTPEQFKAMENDIIELTKKIPMAADGMAQIVASGGQAGIAREELTAYAEAAAKMGVAFDISADEAGQTMAEWRSAFKMNQSEVNKLADQINYLSNTTAASAPKISEVVRRIGPLGEVGGAAADEIAALGATMVAAGVQEEVAATGIKNLILGMVAGEGATKSQAAAFQALGLDAKDMAVMMQDDANGAIMQVMESLQQLPKHKQAAVLSDLFGKESIGAISPLLTNLDGLKGNLEKVSDSSQYAGSMQKEFEARSNTTANSLQLLKNNVSALAITTGSMLLPHIAEIAKKLSAASEKVAAFTEKHPGLTKAIVVGGTAVLGFSVTLTALGFAASVILSPFIGLYTRIVSMRAASQAGAQATRSWTIAQRAWNLVMRAGRALLSVGRLVAYYAVMGTIAGATRAWALAQRLLNITMLANPIGLVIVAIAGLVAAGVALVQNWDTVKAWFTTLWNDPGAAVQQFVDGIKSKFAGVFDWLQEKWNWVKGLFGGGDGGGTPSVNLPLGGHADGGIFNKPHIAWFAEAGPEAAIPLDGSSNAISLWEKAGRILGVMPPSDGEQPQLFGLSGGGIPNNSGGNNSDSQIINNFIFNINGDRNKEEITPLLEKAKSEFAAMINTAIERYMREKRRKAYVPNV